ncbi:MAG: oxidoreductase [Halopseudomonas sabulinigri]|tara:strand:+ start:5006 stop:5842 length:837 start_codon:yes stop_codon:yes gene_type:complete
MKNKTWLITGAARGLGLSIAKSALSAGYNVVATARDTDSLKSKLGTKNQHLLILPLDVTNGTQIAATIAAACDHFGGIDVLINNAGYGLLGAFEQTQKTQIEHQFSTNVFGVFEMCRAVLPVMRKKRSGHIFNISSIAGVNAMAGASVYSASKFAVSGFSEALAQEVAGFGIKVTAVQPGAFQTDFLDPSSAHFADQGIEDYNAFSEKIVAASNANNHQQKGDPDKLAQALLTLSNDADVPPRFLAGADAINMANSRLATLGAELQNWENLSRSTDNG